MTRATMAMALVMAGAAAPAQADIWLRQGYGAWPVCQWS